MGDRFLNILMILIVLTIVGFGGMYGYMVLTDNGYFVSSKETTTPIEQVVNPTPIRKQTINEEYGLSEEIKVTLDPTRIEAKVPTSIPKNEIYPYNNRFYYNQLNDYGKIIYDTIVKNEEKLKTGTERIEVNYDFAKLLKQEDGSEILKTYYDDAINALNLDVPNLFYIDFSKIYLNIETTTSLFSTKYKLYLDSGKNPNYYLSQFSSKEQVEQAIKTVEEYKDYGKGLASGSDYNKIKLVHDWLLEYLEYDMNSVNRGTVYGALIEKKAVCEGYARTYKYILDELGIENVLIVGTATNSSGATEEHMWNYLKLEDTWYAVDVTWDDPIVYGGGRISYETKHEYFLVGSDNLFRNHVERQNISSSGKMFDLPPLGRYKY